MIILHDTLSSSQKSPNTLTEIFHSPIYTPQKIDDNIFVPRDKTKKPSQSHLALQDSQSSLKFFCMINFTSLHNKDLKNLNTTCRSLRNLP